MSRISLNILITVFLLVLPGIITQCKKEKDNTPEPKESTQEYKGTTQCTIRYYAYNASTGQDEFVEEKSYTYACSVFIKSPLSLEGITETNPFNMQVYPDRSGNPDEEGHLDLSSAIFVTGSYGEVLLQHWSISKTGENINGTLTDTHLAEAAAANIIWAWDDVAGMIMTMPFPIAAGCNLNGTLGSGNLDITITGESVNTYRKFTAHISASL